MQCLIIGGTGFLGYHAALELLRRGHRVSVLALPPLPAADLLPPQVQVTLADLNVLSDADLQALLAGHDAVVYAAGADDRVTPRTALGYGSDGLEQALRDTMRACLPD